MITLFDKSWHRMSRRASMVLATAFMWLATALAGYSLAADGDPAGLYEGVRAFQDGDYAHAMTALRPLAKGGHGEAQYYVGFMYGQGLGVAQDHDLAVSWYEKAAGTGHMGAQNYLGMMYFEGRDVARDFTRAFVYFELAAASGNQDAANNRLIVARKMTSEQIAEAQQQARDILAAADQKNAGLSPRRLSSGVIASSDGHILTHFRAVDGCEDLRIRVDGQTMPGEIAVLDRFNGLALISAPISFAAAVAFRTTAARIGESVVVMAHHLDEDRKPALRETETAIFESDRLERVDHRYLQLSSQLTDLDLGAPVFDLSGHVLAIAEPGLRPNLIAKVHGRPPEALSFALNGVTLRLPFDMNGVRYDEAPPDGPKTRAELSDWGAAVTVAIECWRLAE